MTAVDDASAPSGPRENGTPTESGPREHHIEVRRTARYWTLGPESNATSFWMVLHGYKQLARRFLRRFEALDDGRTRVVAPEGLSRFYVEQAPGRHGPESVVGATWMTREDRDTEIADYVAYLSDLTEHEHAGSAGAPKTLLGFSQGVATAARLAVMGRVRYSRLILWGDTLPPDLDMTAAAARLQGVDLVLVRGVADRAVSDRRAEEQRRRLDDVGVRYRELSYDGGHDIDPELLEALRGERSESKRRRVRPDG